MDARAYILIEADAGQISNVITALRSIAGMVTVDAVTGPYDIIATVQLPDPRDVGRLIMSEIHSVAGVKRTITCLTIR